MDKELEVLVEAAEQLAQLKATLKAQGDAASRIRGFTEVIEKVAEQVSRVPLGLADVIARAEAAERNLSVAASSVKELAASVPAIVERIEGSDVGRSVKSLTDSVASSMEDLKELREVSGHMAVVAQQLRESNAVLLAHVTDASTRHGDALAKTTALVSAMRDQVQAEFNKVQTHMESEARRSAAAADATVSAFQQSTSAIRTAGERQTDMLRQIAVSLVKLGDHDIVSLRDEMTKMSQQLTAQGQALQKLASKRGFSF